MRHDLSLRSGDLTLSPLQDQDIAPLMALAAAHAPEYARMGTLPDTLAFYHGGLDAPDQQVFVAQVAGEYAGSTRYMELRPAHRRLEIGSTWLAPQFMRTGVNRGFKRLLMEHAFEVMGMQRVELKTDLLNTRSQTAIEGLGAVREGVLRKHMLRPDGSSRDSVMFSVTDNEWPQVKARLEAGRLLR
ncbi:GNAT family protein [Deinococcus sonorensis]|uniref:GNAT family protein n=2 Tax=Deinococcus sonorensis TaxID=309891 RepID=A0AAU7UFN5_9DEIO